jgi:hypothetical protein
VRRVGGCLVTFPHNALQVLLFHYLSYQNLGYRDAAHVQFLGYPWLPDLPLLAQYSASISFSSMILRMSRLHSSIKILCDFFETSF